MTVVLFDFFGTLVEYSAAPTGQDHTRSHDLLRRYGAGVSYPDYLAGWSQTWAGFERRSDADDRECESWRLRGARGPQSLQDLPRRRFS